MDMCATDQQSGVLLYFYYTPLFGRQTEERQWMDEMCTQLNLRGRVRVARDGINATLGGTLAELKEHARKVAERYDTTEIDFKLSSSDGKKSEVYAKDSGFNSLTVSICKEVVSFGMDSIVPHAEDVTQPPEPAPRISPVEFHALLEAAQNGMDAPHESANKEVVLLDCRNLYETRIGRFQVANVAQLDPETRTFADLPAWIESNTHRLAGRQVLMYCTGGVRCERASAYLRSLGECFRTDGAVYQLQGGIERYLEQFSDGGFFAGKNFVFDERGEKGSRPLRDDGIDELQMMEKEMGKNGAGAPCCCCGTLWHDYSKDRFRCVQCRMLVMICDTCSNAITSCVNIQAQDLCCELCRQRLQCLRSTSLTKTVKALGRRLRILCLHGFRQTGRNFRGRTAALQKRLKEYVEFVFVDGPYRLPFVVQSKMSEHWEVREVSKMLNTSGARDPKRAWLVTPQQLAQLQSTSEESATIDDKDAYQFDENQYKNQTEGWAESYSVLNDALERMGGCDGILGFSQGAAIAAAMAATECKSRNLSKRFKFVVMCSGYISAVPEHCVALNSWRDQGGVPLPSLHVYTADAEADRQIVPSESTALWECFQPRQRTLLRHGNGHLIPSTKAAAARFLHFLEFAMTAA